MARCRIPSRSRIEHNGSSPRATSADTPRVQPPTVESRPAPACVLGAERPDDPFQDDLGGAAPGNDARCDVRVANPPRVATPGCAAICSPLGTGKGCFVTPWSPRHNQLRYAVEHGDERTTLLLAGELDCASAAVAHLALERAGPDAIEIVLDLSRVVFLDAAGLRFLISAQRRARAAQRRLIVRRPSRGVRRMIDLAGVSPLLSIEDPGRSSWRPGRRSARENPGYRARLCTADHSSRCGERPASRRYVGCAAARGPAWPHRPGPRLLRGRERGRIDLRRRSPDQPAGMDSRPGPITDPRGHPHARRAPGRRLPRPSLRPRSGSRRPFARRALGTPPAGDPVDARPNGRTRGARPLHRGTVPLRLPCHPCTERERRLAATATAPPVGRAGRRASCQRLMTPCWPPRPSTAYGHGRPRRSARRAAGRLAICR
jgi:anti-sigma B factor antagonist